MAASPLFTSIPEESCPSVYATGLTVLLPEKLKTESAWFIESYTSILTENGTETSEIYVESCAIFPPVMTLTGADATPSPSHGDSIMKTTSEPTSISILSRVSLSEYTAPGRLSILYIPITLLPSKYSDSSFCAKPSDMEAANRESAAFPLSTYTTENVFRERSRPEMDALRISTSIVYETGPQDTMDRRRAV